MSNTLEQLYHEHYKPSRQAFFQNLIDESHKELIQNLTKADRKLVLRIIDSNDSISNAHNLEAFVCGLNLAMEILTELKQYQNQCDYVSEISEVQSHFSMEAKKNENA